MDMRTVYNRLPGARARAGERSDFTDPVTGQTVPVERADFIHDSRGKRGESSWGTVYEAKYRQDGRPFAIKKIDSIDFNDQDNSPKLAFQREMDFLKQATGWQCPNIVQFHGYIQFSRSAWLILELMDRDLLQVVRRDNFLSDLSLLNVDERTYLGYMMLRDISNGLRFTHGANPEHGNFMHRDIKLNNIMVKSGDRRLAIIDFGSTKQISAEEMRVHSVGAGYHPYSAPECLLSPARYDQKCDMWSLGISIIYFFTGQHPVYHDIVEGSSSSNNPRRNNLITERILGRDFDDNEVVWPIQLNPDGFHPEFAELINRCVSRNASQRPTAQEIYNVAKPIVDRMDTRLFAKLFDRFFGNR